MIRCLAIVSAVIALGLAVPTRAEACSWFVNQPFAVDPDHAGDTVAPVLTTSRWDITRTDLDSSCAGVVALDLWFAATDDRTEAGAFGYEITVVSANVDLDQLGDAVVRPQFGTSTPLSFRTSHTAPPLDLLLSVRAVDLAGNRSAPVDVHVLEPEPEPDDDDDSGCAAGGGGSAGSALLLVLAALVARRPRMMRA